MGRSTLQASNKAIIWPWFIVGCILLVAALTAFFWAFSLEHLSPSRRFLLMWLLPLASGIACACFAGSIEGTGKVATITVATTGGFTVWLLTILLLPLIPQNQSANELQSKLEDDHQEIVRQFDKEAGEERTAEKRVAFDAIKGEVVERLATIRHAKRSNHEIRFRDLTKSLLFFLESMNVQEILSPNMVEMIRVKCVDKSLENLPSDFFESSKSQKELGSDLFTSGEIFTHGEEFWTNKSGVTGTP
jgi:hypothetical protein